MTLITPAFTYAEGASPREPNERNELGVTVERVVGTHSLSPDGQCARAIAHSGTSSCSISSYPFEP